MKRQLAIQVFSSVAIFVGLLVSYYAPAHNAEAIWAMVGSFLGYAIRDLFGQPDDNDASDKGESPAVPPGQSGHAALEFLIALALGVALVANYANGSTAWLMIGMAIGYLSALLHARLNEKIPNGDATHQSGHAMPAILAALALGSILLLGGCGSMNTFTGAMLNSGEQNYAGAKKNIQAIDDMKFMGWADTACALPLGALQRNATNNPNAVPAALMACPISNVGVVQLSNGSISIQSIPPAVVSSAIKQTPTEPVKPQ